MCVHACVYVSMCMSHVSQCPKVMKSRGWVGHSMGHVGHLAGAGTLGATDVVGRLEEAGATLLALPNRGQPAGMRVGWPEVVHDIREAYGYTGAALRPAIPAAAAISRMDEALGWVLLLPSDMVLHRRLVGARMLVSPVTGRHVFSWRRIGGMVGLHYEAVQRQHALAIRIIVVALGARRRAA